MPRTAVHEKSNRILDPPQQAYLRLYNRSEGQRDQREDAGAAVSDQQMRSGPPRYPVDRYLVESSNKIEMVNLIDDDLWNPEPALRPEDEVLLRRLHDLLHSTAADLKLLSGELASHRTPGFQVKTQPVPFDEEFNEKVHIQELVNAKFHGYKIVENPIKSTPKLIPNSNLNVTYSKPNVNTGVQVDSVSFDKKPTKIKNLVVTRTRILEIDEKLDKNAKNKLNNGKLASNKIINNAPAIAYNELTYKHEEPKVTPLNKFKIQDMPSINIRSELKEQKVLQLDIYPDNKQNTEDKVNKGNVTVIAAQHESDIPKEDPKITLTNKKQIQELPSKMYPQTILIKKQPMRKVSKIPTCDSSGSTNVSSDTQHKLKTQKQIKSVIRSSPKTSARERSKKSNLRTEPDSRTNLNIDDWKKKLNVIYGQPSTSRINKQFKPTKKSPKQYNLPSAVKLPDKSILNNAEYIPYSQLTLGGARVSDIEKEISNIPNKNNMPLSPILDRILSSRENSFHQESLKRSKKKVDSLKIFTASDENLLEEVINLEKKVNKTVKKNMKVKIKVSKADQPQSVSSESKEEDVKESYADDFEEENSDNTELAKKDQINDFQTDNESNKSDSDSDNSTSNNDENPDSDETNKNTRNKLCTAKSNLSIKDSVDIFEFVHSVDTQDTATQSNTTHKISLKETQTSPRNDRPKIHPIHNDLWPIDPTGEVEKMFKLEKDFIKKLIVEEYGDILRKNITKPSTSKEGTEDKQKNIAASQKITQTSPARVKSVMTSPAKTKTRTTSPFLSVTVDHPTRPMVVVTSEENFTVQVDNEEDCISINLSSPRFSLRLPQSSREILSNLEDASLSPSKAKTGEKENNLAKSKTFRKRIVNSSSSEVDNSSEMSSLGEVKFNLKRRYKKRISSISESSETSYLSKSSSDLPSGGIIPVRSEGEISFKQIMSKITNKASNSEGEASIGRTK